jgi:hypothetical protein
MTWDEAEPGAVRVGHFGTVSRSGRVDGGSGSWSSTSAQRPTQFRSRSGKAIDDGHSADLIRVKVAQDVGPEALLRQLPGKHAD